jgi:hypothetical protein
LTIGSLTSGGRSVGIVRSRTQTIEEKNISLILFLIVIYLSSLIYLLVRILVEKTEVKNNKEDLDVDVNILLKWIRGSESSASKKAGNFFSASLTVYFLK